MAYQPNNPSFSSDAIHLSSAFGNPTIRDVVPPICLSTIYEQDVPPTYKKGDHVVAQNDLYHGIFNLFNRLNLETNEIEVDFVDASISDNFKNIIRKNTKLVWLETPTNPLMKMVDLQTVTSLIKSQNPSTIIACDNTFLSPYFQRPANFGVDIVMHSCTKFIGGHADVLMGALCTNNEDIYTKLKNDQVFYGPVPSSFDCYLVLRSLKTLEIRMQRHMSNALKVARFLEQHPMIEKVFHPGLESHEHHELSLKQCYGHSGIFSFYIKDHNIDTTLKVVKRLRFILLAESLGAVETTLKIPSIMPPNSLTDEEMKAQGITNGLIRINVGLENPEDIIEDMRQALDF
ncbi:putative cystathionine gamma-synthase [Armadillidium nasatum]|uniref:cystathionine gamma-lyase n=1 Tax=Armadillidium nasatum TaxID=96803 RepID=A0A5N5TK19_9CRUS|nr:putative cystathionine gamma-synthase [Armadillidium nasatum]